jgi:AsmA protein
MKILFKTLKITGITIASLLVLMFLLPYLFPETVTQKIKQWASGSVKTELTFSSTRLSFFKRFPSLTLTLNDFLLKGSAPFQKDTLIAAKEVSLAIDLTSIFKSKININKIYLSQANINIQVDSAGKPNYDVYRSTPKTTAAADNTSASLGIEQILVEQSHLVYDDRSIPVLINARNFNYKGSGDLAKDLFDLHSYTEIGSIDFSYAGQPYVVNKKVNADLVTTINTKSLAFIFEKNDLMINQLPVAFKGRFEFLKDGYDMDFKATSTQSDLSDLFTAMPAAYIKWSDKMDINGTGDIQMSLSGKYIASKKIKPDINFSMKVKDGYVASKNTPSPVKNLFLNMNAKVPGLNPDSMQVNVDSLNFTIGKDYLNAVLKLKGITSPYVFLKVNTEMDLEKWGKAFGVQPFAVKGRYSLHLLADGKYATSLQKRGLRHVDTVISSIPKFSLHSSYKDGYFKYTKLPQAIDHISFDIDANCPDNNIKHADLQIKDVNITALNNYIKGFFNVSNTAGVFVNSGIDMKFHLDDIKKIYPLDKMDLRGDIVANIQTKGKYIPAKRIFPVTKADIDLHNGYVQTKYYPHPIKDIQVSSTIINTSSSLKGLKVIIRPISFNFEDQPFIVKANLRDFENLDYHISSKGTIDVGKIYKIFAINGYNVTGLITTNFSLKGKQSDATAGRYNLLDNKGTMQVKDLVLTSDLFPKRFLIKTGLFSFDQDKMKFDSFTAKYGKSIIVMDGALSNVIDYAIKPNALLQGDFNLKSNLIVADDFMVFADNGENEQQKTTKKASAGVIMVPTNLNMNFTADVKKVKYNGLELNDAKGQMTINKGQLSLKQTGFNLIGTTVVMDADYQSITPQKAVFNYHIAAKDFDIQRAYREIKLFHDMASSAASAQGIVSLDYKLGGRLNSDMRPVYPSLKGGGVLSIKSVKVKGFRLFSTVGKETGRDSLGKGGDVSKVDIKTTIANNIITIERTKMRIAGFRPRFEGQVSLDGKLNLQFRLGLPPLGIFGIPMTITGTQENPKIHMGKGKKEDEIKETDDN